MAKFQLQYNRNRRSKAVTKQQVKQMILGRIEDKILSITSTGSPGTTGTVSYYSAIQQGDGLSDRSGNTIRPKWINLRIGYTDVATGFVRFILLQDSENTGTIPTVTTVLQSATWNSDYDTTQFATTRWKILFDKTHALSTPGDLSVFDLRKIYLKGDIHFSGTGNTSTSAGKNALYFLTITSTATAALDFRSNMCFTDA